MSCAIYCCCRCRKCKKNGNGQESYNGSIVGFSNTDQQSLIEPKGILKHRENSYSTSGAELARFGQTSTCGYQEMQETRSLQSIVRKAKFGFKPHRDIPGNLALFRRWWPVPRSAGYSKQGSTSLTHSEYSGTFITAGQAHFLHHENASQCLAMSGCII